MRDQSSNFGPLEIILSILPFIILITYFYKRDRKKKEPLGMILFSFVSGVFIIFPAIFLEELLIESLRSFKVAPIFHSGIVGGVIEESLKFLSFLLLIFNNKNFDEPFDAIFYSVLISLGFAFLENILYVYRFGVLVAFLRPFTAISAHTMFGIVMGYFFMKAKFLNSVKSLKLLYLSFALIVPISVHFLYNFIISMKDILGGLTLILLIIYFQYMIKISKTSINRSDKL
ncbi:MAG: PrsW family glutamic-type intramembrane protease [bacterium]|uniref:Protease PrsW n=1 Tax=candidate division TA06 bacterium 34_109 TaxID=1635277 RepID=A0A101I1J3_UNCT6|nr:MAG: Protease PrsW [candidate division TA06 bacterium 32_111]KUK86115.1 MAG: Protease PrsW [candidate division TA06 bacterium 34_109]MDI6699923.1 PrsW family glutamic-type intramembrane protease [bacterium]